MTTSANHRIYGVVFLAAIISCFIAFFNNFPLLYQDTGSYIRSGFEPLVYPDRPIFYGLFIKFFSCSASLWFVILAQALLVCYILFVTLGMYFEGFKRSCIFISIITFITICTGFSYNVSILIPDIFSAISILCLVNLLLNKNMGLLQTIFIQCLFVFSICTQFSSIAIMLVMFVIFILYVIIQKLRKRTLVISVKRLALSFLLFLSCLLLIPAVHYSVDKKFRISGSNHVFAVNHLLENGILEDYLSQACKDHSYKICAYKDSLGWELVWSPTSPVMKTGGWEANEKEYNAIIKDVFTTPKYFKMIVLKSAEYSFKQFFTFDVSVCKAEFLGSPQQQIVQNFRSSLHEFYSSHQNSNALNIGPVNVIQQVVVLISMVFLFVILITPFLFRRLSFSLRATLVIIIAHNILNSILCSNLSTVHDRFQNRLAWMFPVFAVVIIIQLIDHQKNTAVIPPENLS